MIQPKLEIGAPDDEYERAAERIARRVTGTSESDVAEPDDEVPERTRTSPGTRAVAGEHGRRIRALQNGGRRLPESTRSFFERRFGHDFGDVRIHTDSRADEAARALNANAFTIGRHVVFRSGAYRPGSERGKELLAHELTHVVQQRTRGASPGVVQREVRSISCAGLPDEARIFDVIEPDDAEAAVRTIERADSTAVNALDAVIFDLEHTRSQIRSGEPAEWPLIPEAMATALSSNFGIDPGDRTAWTDRGPGTVQLVLQRLRGVRDLLRSGSIHYTCLGKMCSGEVAYSYESISGETREEYRERLEDELGVEHGGLGVYLCPPWWDDNQSEQAVTLIHEAMHIRYPFLRHEDGLGGIRSYTQFILDYARVADLRHVAR